MIRQVLHDIATIGVILLVLEVFVILGKFAYG